MNLIKISLFKKRSILGLLLAFSAVCADESSMKHEIFEKFSSENSKLNNSESLLDTFEVDSRIGCIHSCLDSSTCISVNLKVNTAQEVEQVQCELMSSIAQTSDGLYASPGWEYYR
ncbi:hypothetical protein PoB_003258600 [Plakobranchus ocellatus]|uniref:Apple domain-containing protein n=1 Tax=Plakobranchus ocellatus TaxID=259542 RepID=A0AAV4ACI4_9GAST|nr:hypothetical protein PoB_003258600 [Plakobranchus ocellatus]